MRPSTTLALATCGVPPKVVQRIEAEIGAVTAERDAYREALTEMNRDGCGVMKPGELPCYESQADRSDWCWSCLAHAVLARFAPATEEDDGQP